MASSDEEATVMSYHASIFTLSADDLQRYSRQLILKGWSAAQQRHLATLTVAVSTELPAAALYLAALGVGQLCLISGNKQQREDLREDLLRLRPDLTIYGTQSAQPDAALLLKGEGNYGLSECSITVCIDIAAGEIRLNNVPQQLKPPGSALSSAGVLGNLGVLLLLSQFSDL